MFKKTMNILITGASKGLGAALARKFGALSQGTIILTARDEKRLNELKKAIEEKNPEIRVLVYSLDLKDDKQILDFTSGLKTLLSDIDVLINNAGQIINKAFEEISQHEAKEIFEVNYFAASSLIKNLIPLLKASENAHVINIGSMGGFQGSAKFNGLSQYSASKAAIGVLTECLAQEYADYGISFNCLAIGSVQTEMLEKAFPGYKAPLNPDQLAEFIFDFSLKGHKYMNGKILPVSLSTP
jgi:short-subunit dehydrogenase